MEMASRRWAPGDPSGNHQCGTLEWWHDCDVVAPMVLAAKGPGDAVVSRVK